MTNAAIKELIAQGVADDSAEYEANRSSGNGDDSHDSGSDRRRTEHTTRECTYSDFLKCQPLNFKALMCERMFPEEFDEVEKYFGGIPDMIQDRPKTKENSTTTKVTTTHHNRLSRGKVWFTRRHPKIKWNKVQVFTHIENQDTRKE
uniref:Reverse transcriptase domain-containing protein n=1 Tax=Tanacetum cinerariifolium TaxID=118510 RepID=A0A6L2KL76_TANCI|nr:hypothetical protein [Tanacetum cinerariifolium]